MNKLVHAVVLLGLLSTSGCAALKETTGEYIIESVTSKVTDSIETQLNVRGLSLKDLQSLADDDGDGQVNMAEIRDTVKDMTKDFVLLQGQDLVEDKVAEYSRNFVQNSDLDNKSKDWLLALLGSMGAAISTYLGKQVYSAKKDGKRDERIAVIEKLLQKDLDGDGRVGDDVVV
jgi:hypothetical protein